MKNKILLAASLLFFAGSAAFADEGMWMINAIDKALERKMVSAGLELSGSDIYNVEDGGLCDAVVSLDFMCTGSMISEQGLLITNHHCAYSDVYALSTPEHNYLEDGYWAFHSDEEIYIPDKHVQFLKRVVDVTDEVQAVTDSLAAIGQKAGSRKLSHILETRWKAATGLEASLSSMWAGSKWYLALYEEYSDVRLVAAPPVSIAAFGGDIDNWEWPQQKCDFALYRVYAAPDGSPAEHSEHNVPLNPGRILSVCTTGYAEGDYAMVIGYPGRTDRHASAAKISYMENLSLPIINQIRGEQMDIIQKWMNADPAVRLLYSDQYFSLSNVQELSCGEVLCFDRYDVARKRKSLERRTPGLRRIGRQLEQKYENASEAESDVIWYRETLVRGCKMGLVSMRLRSKSVSGIKDIYEQCDMRVERDLFDNAVCNYYGHVSRQMWGPYQDSLYTAFDGDCSAIAASLWTDRQMTVEDPIYRFYTDVKYTDFNSRVDSLQGPVSVYDLGRQYTRRLYSHRVRTGRAQYPDANSTMRLTYGNVKSYQRDGEQVPWQTFGSEILAKEDSTRYEYTLKPAWHDLLSGNAVRGTAIPPVNFITTNDITGGNSGSPVMNSRGQLIGLAFDGNKESLDSDCTYTAAYNRCVCVDIRFVLWTLERYAGMGYILDELKFD